MMEITSDSATDRSVVSVNDLKIVACYRDLLTRNALDTLEAFFDPQLGESLGKPGLASWRERRRVDLDDEGTTRTFYLKRFANSPPRIRQEIRRAGCGAKSIAGIEWGWMRKLSELGIACADPVALGEEVVDGCPRRSAILMASVPGRSLETWAHEWSAEDHAKVRRLLRPLAEMVATLHKAGVVHRDLYLSHIFFDATGAIEDSLWLIDLQRVFTPKTMMRRWIVKDLAALNYSTPWHVASTTDRIRWLKMYLGITRLHGDVRRLLHRVVHKTERIGRHDAKKAKRRAEG